MLVLKLFEQSMCSALHLHGCVGLSARQPLPLDVQHVALAHSLCIWLQTALPTTRGSSHSMTFGQLWCSGAKRVSQGRGGRLAALSCLACCSPLAAVLCFGGLPLAGLLLSAILSVPWRFLREFSLLHSWGLFWETEDMS